MDAEMRLKNLRSERARYGFLFVILACGIFASHLRDGYLSDDFLYVAWARRSLATLLAHLTISSYPQVLRPLPAFAWLLSRFASGPLWLHLLALAVHGANSALLFAICRKWGAARSTAFTLGFLFLVFPLSGETVLWLSSGFDLWAVFFALLAVAALQKEQGIGLGLLFYALALLCKESALCLPLVFLLLFPRLRWRIFPFFLTAGLYLAMRFALFGGIGGYKDHFGRAVVTQLHLGAFLRALAVQVPARILAPVPVESRLAFGGMIALSLILLCGFGASGFRPRKAVLAAAGVFVAAILPAAPLLRVEWDLQGARLLYLPLALGLVALARFTRPPTRIATVSGAVLAGYWMIAAVLNGSHWSAASQQARQTLDAMKTLQPGFPPGSTVLVDAPDTYQGAYVFRNGLSEAAELAGLRQNLHWRRGTAALLGPGAGRDLGVRVFEIGAEGDWTTCARALFTLPGPSAPLSLVPASAQSWVSIPVAIAETRCHSVTLSTSCGENTGTLFWKTTDTAPFTTMRSRDLKLSGELQGPRPAHERVLLGAGRVEAVSRQLRSRPRALGARRLPFSHALQIGKAGLEVPADHLVHVEEDPHDLRDEGAGAMHGPRDVGGAARGLQRELGDVVPFERLDKIQLNHDLGRRRGFRDLHASRPDVAVAFPRVQGTLAAGRPAIGSFQLRVLVLPGRPGGPAMEVRDQRKDRFGRRLDARRALNAQDIRPGRSESEESGEQNDDDDGDSREHGFLPRSRAVERGDDDRVESIPTLRQCLLALRITATCPD